MKIGLTLFWLCLLFVSCNKKGTVTGIVTNLFDNTPIEGQELHIDYTNNNALNWKHGGAAQAFSDSKGEFQMDVDYKYSKRMHYSIRMWNSNQIDTSGAPGKIYLDGSSYFHPDIGVAVGEVSKNKTEAFAFKAVPACLIRISAIDDLPLNPNAMVFADLMDPFMPSVSLFAKHEPQHISTGTYVKVAATGWVKFSIRVMDQFTVDRIDSLAIAPFQKGTYYLHY